MDWADFLGCLGGGLGVDTAPTRYEVEHSNRATETESYRLLGPNDPKDAAILAEYQDEEGRTSDGRGRGRGGPPAWRPDGCSGGRLRWG